MCKSGAPFPREYLNSQGFLTNRQDCLGGHQGFLVKLQDFLAERQDFRTKRQDFFAVMRYLHRSPGPSFWHSFALFLV